MKLKESILTGWLLLLLCIATAAVFWKIDFLDLFLGRVQLWDFDVYYQTAVDVFAGANPYQLPYMQTAGPPAVIIPYLPFTLVSLPVARSLLNSLNVIATLASCWLIITTVFRKQQRAFIQQLNLMLLLNLIFWLTFLPRYNLIVGQPNLIIMFLVTVLLVSLRSVDERLSSKRLVNKAMSLAATLLLKTHYVVAAVSLLRFQLRTVVVTGAILIALVLVSLPVLTPQHYRQYVQDRLGIYMLSAPPIPDLDYYNQSLRSTLSRLDIRQLYPVIGLGLLLVGTIYLVKTGDFGSGILLSLLLSPIVWQHYLVVVYPIAIFTIYEYWQQKKVPWLALIGVSLLILHLPWLHGRSVSVVLGLLASHFYFGVLLMWLSRVRLTMIRSIKV